jgi:hypothetical protein
MSPVVERLVELRRHLDHLRRLLPRVESAAALRENLSLHNDVLFSLLVVSQLVIDVAAELSARRGLRFEDYRQAVRCRGARHRGRRSRVTPGGRGAGTSLAPDRAPGPGAAGQRRSSTVWRGSQQSSAGLPGSKAPPGGSAAGAAALDWWTTRELPAASRTSQTVRAPW